MKSYYLTLIQTFIFLSTVQANGQSATSQNIHNEEALQKTQNLLTDPNVRAEAIKKDPNAMEMDKRVGATVGSKENKEKTYQISAEVMQVIYKKTNGDPKKMQELVEQAQRDPKTFYDNFLNASQQAEVKAMAQDIEKKQQSSIPRN